MSRSASVCPLSPNTSMQSSIPPGRFQLLSTMPMAPVANSMSVTASSSPCVRAWCTCVAICEYTLLIFGLPRNHQQNAIPWHPRSMTAPPPDCSTSQNQSECGPECFSPCFTRCTRPNAPSSASCFAFTYFGAKNSSSAYSSSTPALRHASIIASASSSVRHSGFSLGGVVAQRADLLAHRLVALAPVGGSRDGAAVRDAVRGLGSQVDEVLHHPDVTPRLVLGARERAHADRLVVVLV